MPRLYRTYDEVSNSAYAEVAELKREMDEMLQTIRSNSDMGDDEKEQFKRIRGRFEVAYHTIAFAAHTKAVEMKLVGLRHWALRACQFAVGNGWKEVS